MAQVQQICFRWFGSTIKVGSRFDGGAMEAARLRLLLGGQEGRAGRA